MDVEMALCKEMDQLEVDPDYKKLKKDIEVFMQIDDVNYRMAFNKDDNVYDVAMGFITKHALNPDYLDEIMIFVEKNIGYTKPIAFDEYFLFKEYHVDFNVDFNALKEKFIDVTKLVPEGQRLSYEDIKEILLLVNVPEDVTYRQFQLLDAVLSWADEAAGQHEIIHSESKFCLRISKAILTTQHLKTYNTDQNSCVYIEKFTRFIELPLL
ncbi:hypothetical protein CDAR_121221 [Caerostris darwini]|uniref:PFU domain-containing protein n=1 Tax=Caerostris darwini TaxID=1538125 RepID=A0AAV4VH89_9ARAC|nr:hypothetical protein CDAR_121221 [Caerostris darwini]